MKLRSFRPSDFETLYAIDQSCFPPGISYTRDELGRFMRSQVSRTWVAEAGEEVVGFLIADRHPPLRLGHIITVDVLASWRQQGVGTALMEAAETWACRQGIRAISLETAEDNRVAQDFYERRGYVKVERLPGYYADGTAAWIMVKLLGSGHHGARI